MEYLSLMPPGKAFQRDGATYPKVTLNNQAIGKPITLELEPTDPSGTMEPSLGELQKK